MLINTLQTLVMAGKDALHTTCDLRVTKESVTQIRHGNLTFPSLGEIVLSGGTLQRLHLGCDSMLCGHLAENLQVQLPGGGSNGLEILARALMDNVIEGMDGRRPQGFLENLEVGPRTLTTRGVRTFGIRLTTDIGNLYLLAEVPSRSEWEQAKGSEFMASMIDTHLPEGWSGREHIAMAPAIDRFLIFLRKTELDVQVEAPDSDGVATIHTGTLVETSVVNGQRVLCLTMDLSGPDGRDLVRGDELHCRVGLQERALTFRAHFQGEGRYNIAGDAGVKCVYLSVPDRLRIEQRRRAFRINPAERIPVEIFPEDDGAVALSCPADREGDGPSSGRLADISFSGARIVADRDHLLSRFEEGSRVICRLHFPGEEWPLELLAVIRRASFSMVDGDSAEGEIGLEFLVSEDHERTALEYIRQYVLSEQRAWLAQRIHVAGAPQW